MRAAYSIAFDQPVKDPVLHLQSLASTLTFADVPINKLSGESVLSVSGNIVSGVIDDSKDPVDANGTIQLIGSFDSIDFTAYTSLGQGDGFSVQVGADVPEPSTLAIWGILGGLGLIAARRRRKRVA